MAGIVDTVVQFAANNPVATFFGGVLLLFIFGGYLLLRRTITQFREGFEGQQ